MQVFATFSLLRRSMVTCLFILGAGSVLIGQNSSSAFASEFNWKPVAEMEQTIQQELSDADAVLAQPNLTDWTIAMTEAYKSFLTFTQSEWQSKKDILEILDLAYEQMKNETVSNPAARAMVLDDMKSKQTELILKLSFN